MQKLPHLYRRAATSAGEATTVSSATAARSGVEKENSRASKPQVGRGSYAVAGQLLRLAISSRSPYVSYFEFSNIIYSLQYSGIKRDCVDTTQMHVSLPNIYVQEARFLPAGLFLLRDPTRCV